MTPEEQARADAINDALAASIQKRKAQPYGQPAADLIKEPKGKGPFYYGAICAFVVALHIAGAFVYSNWQQKRTAEKESARLAEANTRRLQEEAAHAEFIRQQAERDAQRARIQATNPAPRSTTPAAATPSNVQYNVMPSPPPVRASQPPRQVRSPAPAPQAAAAPAPSFTQSDHADVILKQADTYFNGEAYAKHLGVMDTYVEAIRVDSVFHDTFWNKYVTTGEVRVRYRVRPPGQSYTRTLKFEGETQVKGGRIQITSNVRPK